MIKNSIVILVFYFGLLVEAGSVEPVRNLQPLPEVDLSAYEISVASQLVEARENVEKVAATDGENQYKKSEAYGLLGKIYHAYGLLAAAKACYNNAGSLNSDNIDWPFLYAIVSDELGEHGESISALKHVLGKDSDNLSARIRLATKLREQALFAEALEQLNLIEGNSLSMPVVQAELGELALAQGDNLEAVRYLKNAIEQVPEANRLHYPLAIAMRNLGQQDLARDHMSKRGDVGLMVADPLMEEIQALKVGERVHLLRGKLAFASGDYSDAARAFQAAVEAKPDSARAYINLGSALFALGQTERSREQYEKALELDPQNVTAMFNLGASALRAGKADMAKPYLENAIELTPNDVDARLLLASAFQGLEEFSAAFEQYQSAAKIDNQSLAAWMGMVKLLTAAEQYAESLAVLQQANSALPNNDRIIHARARMLAASPDTKIRDGRQAKKLAQQAFDTQPSLDRAYTVSLALAETGKCKDAAKILEQEWSRFIPDAAEMPTLIKQTADYYRENKPCNSAPVW